jgi:hypothetical protein
MEPVVGAALLAYWAVMGDVRSLQVPAALLPEHVKLAAEQTIRGHRLDLYREAKMAAIRVAERAWG